MDICRYSIDEIYFTGVHKKYILNISKTNRFDATYIDELFWLGANKGIKKN